MIKLQYVSGSPGQWFAGFETPSGKYEYETWDKMIAEHIRAIGRRKPGAALQFAKNHCLVSFKSKRKAGVK